METFTAILAAFLDVLLAMLDKLDAARAAEFRSRCAADPAGVLLEQLNPGTSPASCAQESSTGGTGRKSGAVDE